MMSDKDIQEYHNIGKAIKHNEKYKYINGKQITDHETGTRVYEINNYRLPSVTTILGATKNQQFLKDWKAKVGEQEAERIKNLSSRRGTAMHKFIESHVEGVGYDDLTEVGQEAKPMAKKIIEMGLTPVEEYYGSEVMLHYPGLYAGSTDLVCLHDGVETIIDFKQANRPKNKDWIDDYFLQLAAYGMAHNHVYNTKIQGGVILMCSPELVFQRFFVTPKEYQVLQWRWLKRVDLYYKMKESGIRDQGNL